MPLKFGNEYKPDLSLPNNLTAKEEVFVVKYTGEILRNYSDYASKIKLYQARIWGCQNTGRTNLTYEEALKSEGFDTSGPLQVWHDVLKPQLRQFAPKDTAEPIQNQTTKSVFSGQEDFMAQQTLNTKELLHKLGEVYSDYKDLLHNYQPDLDISIYDVFDNDEDKDEDQENGIQEETLEQVEQRFKYEYEQSLNSSNRNISLKYLIFQELINVKPIQNGLKVSDIVDLLEQKKISPFLDTRQAKSSVSSTCSHDSAFFRLGPATFTLRALPELKMQVEKAGKPKSAMFFQVEKQLQQLQQKEQQIIVKLEEMERVYLPKNVHKCSKCSKVQHQYNSPLVLCDYCSRSYHLACLEKNWTDLPADTWACPKCQEKHIQFIKRLVELDLKKKEQIERVQQQEKENKIKQTQRLSQKTVKMQQIKDKQYKDDLKRKERDFFQNSTDLPASPQRTGVVTLKLFQQLFQKIAVREDFDAVQYYKEYLDKLRVLQNKGTYYVDKALIEELQCMVQGPDNLFKNLSLNQDLDVSLSFQTQQSSEVKPIINVYTPGPKKSKSANLDLQAQSQIIQNALYEVIIFSHFLYSFNQECEVSFLNSAQIIDLVQLDQQVLSQEFVKDFDEDDHKHQQVKKAEQLEDLYMGLLNCVLISQMEQLEPTSWRSKRWARILERNEYLFQSILQRTLLTIFKGNKLSATAQHLLHNMAISSHQLISTQTYAKEKIDQDLTNLINLLAPYDVLYQLQDHEFAYYVAQLIDVFPVICLPPLIHLRLLNIMATQILNGEGLRNIIQNRNTRLNELWIDKYYKMAEARRNKGQPNNPKTKPENQTQSGHNSEDDFDDDDFESNQNSENQDLDNQSSALHNKSQVDTGADLIKNYNISGVANVMGQQWIQDIIQNQIRVDILGQDRFYADYYWTPNDKQRIYRILKVDSYTDSDQGEQVRNNSSGDGLGVRVKEEEGDLNPKLEDKLAGNNLGQDLASVTDNLQVGFIDTPLKLDKLLRSLSHLGERERHLKTEIRKNYGNMAAQFKLQESLQQNQTSESSFVDNNIITQKQMQVLIQDPIQCLQQKQSNKLVPSQQLQGRYDSMVQRLHRHMITSCVENVKENFVNFIAEYKKNPFQDEYWEVPLDHTQINTDDFDRLLQSIKYVEEHLNYVSMNSYRRHYQNTYFSNLNHDNPNNDNANEEQIEDQLQQEQKIQGGIKVESGNEEGNQNEDGKVGFENILTAQKRNYNIDNLMEKELEGELEDFEGRIAPYQELIDSDQEDQPLILKDKRYVDRQRTKLNHIVEYYLRHYEFDIHYKEYLQSENYKKIQKQYQDQIQGLATESQIAQDQKIAIDQANNLMSLPTGNALLNSNLNQKAREQNGIKQEPSNSQPGGSQQDSQSKQGIKKEEGGQGEQVDEEKDKKVELKLILFQMLSLWRNQLERKFWLDQIQENQQNNRMLNLCYYLECFLDRAVHYTKQLEQRIQYKEKSIQNRVREIHQYQNYLLQVQIKQRNQMQKKQQQQLLEQQKFDNTYDDGVEQRRTRDSNKQKKFKMFDKLDMIPDSEEPEDLARGSRRRSRMPNLLSGERDQPARQILASRNPRTGKFEKAKHPPKPTQPTTSYERPTRQQKAPPQTRTSSRSNKGRSTRGSMQELEDSLEEEQDGVQSDDDDFELDQFSDDGDNQVQEQESTEAEQEESFREQEQEEEDESSEEYVGPRTRPSNKDKMVIDKKVWEDIDNETEEESSVSKSIDSQDESAFSDLKQEPKVEEPPQQAPPQQTPQQQLHIQRSKPLTRKYEVFELGQKPQMQTRKRFRNN